MHDLTRRHRAMLMGFGLLLNISLLAQCPTGDVLITSQTDADNYASTFPNCDTLPGDLVFSGINIDDLSGFANVEVIQGDLHYNNTFPGPYDFTGFQSLTHIGGDLKVTNCQYWRSFAGLDNLERVEGSVVAQYVDSIEGVGGLFNLDHVGGDLLIWGGPLMYGLAGLNDLDTVMGQVQVLMGDASGALPDQLEYVGGDFRVTSGTNQLTGAAQLTRIDGHLLLGSPNLPAPNAFPVLGVVHDLLIGLDNVPTINLNILPALDTVVNNLQVGANSTLTSFAGLNAIEYIGGWLLFDDCEDLVTITQRVPERGHLREALDRPERRAHRHQRVRPVHGHRQLAGDEQPAALILPCASHLRTGGRPHPTEPRHLRQRDGVRYGVRSVRPMHPEHGGARCLQRVDRRFPQPGAGSPSDRRPERNAHRAPLHCGRTSGQPHPHRRRGARHQPATRGHVCAPVGRRTHVCSDDLREAVVHGAAYLHSKVFMRDRQMEEDPFQSRIVQV
ncbi:MAG: hypothetical protein IPG69_18445 [Flavobacteriales bacterium]|nr:hypothetical protein [Flavobacteriales bacterium]